jgi:hypothetical protein
MSPHGQTCTRPLQLSMKVHGWLMAAHVGDAQVVPVATPIVGWLGWHSHPGLVPRSNLPDPASVVYSPLHDSLVNPPHNADDGSVATQQRLAFAEPRASTSTVAPSAPTPTVAPSAPTLAAPPSASAPTAPPSASKESSGDGGGPPHAKQKSAASVPRVAKVFMPLNLARPLVSASGKLMRRGTHMGAP